MPRASSPRLYQAARLGVESSSEPPGLRTRWASSIAESVSTRCSMTSLMITTSTLPDLTGRPVPSSARTSLRPAFLARVSAAPDPCTGQRFIGNEREAVDRSRPVQLPGTLTSRVAHGGSFPAVDREGCPGRGELALGTDQHSRLVVNDRVPESWNAETYGRGGPKRRLDDDDSPAFDPGRMQQQPGGRHQPVLLLLRYPASEFDAGSGEALQSLPLRAF